jgi:hypothetical protein
MAVALEDVSRVKESAQMTATETSQFVCSGDDFEQIRQIVAGYCHIVDRAMQRGETPDVSMLFHPDALFTNSFQSQEWVGRDAIVEWYHKYLGRRKGHFRFTRHKIYASHQEFEGKTVKSICHFDADSLDFHGIIRRMCGQYEDVLEKYRDQWLILKRHINIPFIPGAIQADPFKGWR